MTHALTSQPHHESHDLQHEQNLTTLGFWIYLMTDALLFAGLFAVFMTTPRPEHLQSLFEPKNIMLETGLLLLSSFTFGLAWLSWRSGKTFLGWLFLLMTFGCGVGFLGLEIAEFHTLILQGHGPDTIAYWSAFFTLVGTHGLHVTIGLLWMLMWMVSTLIRKTGADATGQHQMMLLGLFWHFLDIIWVVVVSLVYLGAFVS